MDFDEILQKLIQENSKSVSEEALRLLNKIAENILKDPSNLKLRRLQKNNATVSKKILSVSSALQCLKLMGFEEVSYMIFYFILIYKFYFSKNQVIYCQATYL